MSADLWLVGNKQGVQCLGISPTDTPYKVVAMWVAKGLGLGLWHMEILG